MTFSFLEAYEVFTYRKHRITTIMKQTSDGCEELSFLVRANGEHFLFDSVRKLLAYTNGEQMSQKPLTKKELMILKDELNGKYDS